MDVTRRRFLAGCAAASAVAGLSGPGLATAMAEPLYPAMDLSGFDAPLDRGEWKLRVGCAAITWGSKVDEAAQQIAAVGYPGLQFLANVIAAHPDPASVKAMLAKERLEFVALSSGSTELDPAKEQTLLAQHEAHAKYLHAAGGGYLQVIGAGSPKGSAPSWTEADYKRQGYLLTEIGKRAAEFGVHTGFHNHMNTIGQTPEAVAAIMAAVDPRYVKLELDVAHYLQGGGDPAEAVRQYRGRLLYLHLKDTKPTSNGGYEFVELGQGRVDFKALLAALKETRFRGWGVVELDGERTKPTRTPEESARMSKQYLESLGVQV